MLRARVSLSSPRSIQREYSSKYGALMGHEPSHGHACILHSLLCREHLHSEATPSQARCLSQTSVLLWLHAGRAMLVYIYQWAPCAEVVVLSSHLVITGCGSYLCLLRQVWCSRFHCTKMDVSIDCTKSYKGC